MFEYFYFWIYQDQNGLLPSNCPARIFLPQNQNLDPESVLRSKFSHLTNVLLGDWKAYNPPWTRNNDDANRCVLFYLKIQLMWPKLMFGLQVMTFVVSRDHQMATRRCWLLVGVLANSWNLIRTKDGAATHNTATHSCNTATLKHTDAILSYRATTHTCNT